MKPLPDMAEPLPGWVRPPSDGFTADDLDRLPALPRHSQLIDGSLVFTSRQTAFHSVTIDMLERGLRQATPGHLRVRARMTIVLGARQRPEPDLIVIRTGADPGPKGTAYQAADVVLAVEVVSADSEVRDRERKPQLYAKAGIRHFWRVENDSGLPIAYTYELDPATHAYVPTGIHHDRLKTTVPYDIDIDLAEIDSL